MALRIRTAFKTSLVTLAVVFAARCFICRSVSLARHADGNDTASTAVRVRIQERLEADTSAGRPLIVHVIVALCDNRYQGIVPVPKHLGNGQDARNNLYWGAMYGVSTFLTRNGWRRVQAEFPLLPKAVLKRIVLHKHVKRSGRNIDVYLVAEAWDGKHIKSATERFLLMAAGRKSENLRIQTADAVGEIQAGAAAHLIAYVGHNGLMDFSLADLSGGSAAALPRSAVVLACRSKQYFQKPLKRADAHLLLLTTGFMAPEAYTLDAVVTSWASGDEPQKVRESAAHAYHKYQKCGLKPARNLFFSEPYDAATE